MRPSFSIARHELHLWRGDLRSFALLDGGFVSQEEEARANAFVFERDQIRYRRGRAVLRLLLSRYTGKPASELVIAGQPHMKPALQEANIRFNVSHSGDAYVLAISQLEVGVDIEVEREADDALQLGKNVFSAEENVVLQSAPQADRSHAFLLSWTRKEAFVKALGIGLGGVDLTAITVGLEAKQRTVPPLPGISSHPIAIRSYQSAGQYIATACDPVVTHVAIRELDGPMLQALV